MSTAIRPKNRDAVIQALRAGVVPRAGQHLIQVGRVGEIQALLRDIERISDGGTSFRFVIGEYGSGKTFFLNLVRAIALEKKLVTVNADLNPDRRLHGTSGQARSLYAELMNNISTRTKPDGGALPGIVEKFIYSASTEAREQGVDTQSVIQHRLERLSEMVNGYDFATVIAAYCRGHEEGRTELKADAIRWLRGEFATRTDARKALGVRAIVDDASVYDQLKLMSLFVRLSGFSGLFICLDELVNLYKLSNSKARASNYEQLLRMLNDVLQGTTEGVGFVLGGTPEFLLDTRRGVYSYAALQSRLSENTFAKDGLVDLSHPVIRLQSLTPEDFFVLLHKVQHVFTYGDDSKELLPEAGIHAFMAHCLKRVGEAYFRTPRTTITSFINLLSILEQNPATTWKELLDGLEVKRDLGAASDAAPGADQEPGQDDEFSTFQL